MDGSQSSNLPSEVTPPPPTAPPTSSQEGFQHSSAPLSAGREIRGTQAAKILFLDLLSITSGMEFGGAATKDPGRLCLSESDLLPLLTCSFHLSQNPPLQTENAASPARLEPVEPFGLSWKHVSGA